MNYYERHIGDYLKDTAHLSLLEHGVYTRLLDVYYTRETPIPKTEVARLIGARSKDERTALYAVLDEFFVPEADAYAQHRCDLEIRKFADKSGKAKRSAMARWDAKRLQSEGNANASPDAMRTHCEGNAPNPQTPDTRHQTPERKERSAKAQLPPCPDDVNLQVYGDWVQLRKAKRAPVSQTVIDEARAEAEKAGLSLERFLSIWCARGSQGLQADWLKPNERMAGASPANTNKFAAAAKTIFGDDAADERRTINA